MPVLSDPSAYRDTLAAVCELAQRLTDEHWRAPTECPQWTVGDLHAHMVALEHWMSAGAPQLPGEPQAWIDEGVHGRRGRSRHQVVEELLHIASVRDGQLAGQGDPGAATGWWPWLAVQIPLGRLWATRVFDLWVHEQDVRRAVGMPGHLGSPGALVSQQTIFEALPRVVAKSAALPPGTSIRVTVDGQLPADVCVSVQEGGRAVAGPAEGPASAEIRIGWETLRLATTGRARPSQGQVTVAGDADAAHRVLWAWNVAP